MEVRILTLNCQRAHRKRALANFLKVLLKQGAHDFILLQEADHRVYDILSAIGVRKHGYALATEHSSHMNGFAEECILHKIEHKLKKKEFFSFNTSRNYQDKDIGILSGHFMMQSKRQHIRALVCCAHLHAGMNSIARRRERRAIKKILLMSNEDLKIVGGDFNSFLPGETFITKSAFLPELTHATAYDAFSHETLHLEPSRPTNRVFRGLAQHGINLKTRIDHVFVSSSWKCHYASRVIEVLVSDHKPVEVLITGLPLVHQ